MRVTKGEEKRRDMGGCYLREESDEEIESEIRVVTSFATAEQNRGGLRKKVKKRRRKVRRSGRKDREKGRTKREQTRKEK